MADGAGNDVVPGPQATQEAQGRRRRRRKHQAAALIPLDIVAEIAARSDPVTLVRCAATCRDMRGRVADPGFRRRLRLRHADRFVTSLLRGHLVEETDNKAMAAAEKDKHMCLVDATARLVHASESFPPGPDGEPLALHRPVSAREGLVLVRRPDQQLRVYNLATGRSQSVPPAAEFVHAHHVLLVGEGEGGGAVGRPFQVVKASLVLEQNRRRLQVQTFSSEVGTWGPCAEIRTPKIHGEITERSFYHPPRPIDPLLRALVAGGAVHWLCLTDKAGYVLKLRVRAAAPQLTVTELPKSYPHNQDSLGRARHLLATMEAGGSPAVLVADDEKICAWTPSRHTGRWNNQQPQVVIKLDAMAGLLDHLDKRRMQAGWIERPVSLAWFGERSGIVLIRMYEQWLFWLDLQSREIVRWSKDPKICRNNTIYQPCEMDLSTWVPTFSSSL